MGNSTSSAGDERQPLLPQAMQCLDPEDEIDHDGCFPPHGIRDLCPANPHSQLPVYVTIHRIRRDVIAAIDDPYSIEQLRDPRMNLSVVRPLVDKLYELDDVSVVYCLLVNRVRFQREQSAQPHQQSVAATRALLCEMLANRILRRFHEDNTGAQGLLCLAHILVGSFDPFQGAPQEVRDQSELQLHWTVRSRSGFMRKLPALEIAIISESKIFLSSSACQMVVRAIYEGRVIYTPTSFIDILPDHYKYKPVSLYNPRKGPILNQYRLIVPRTRNYLEIIHFIVLLALFLSVMAHRDASHFGALELVFVIYTFGLLLDMFATVLEHGWHVYTQNIWSFLDITFALVFIIYFSLRIHAWRTDSIDVGQQALDVLAMGAPVLIPRLAFNLMSENMLFVSLRAMMRDFTILTVLAVWCFAGFLLSMTWLANGSHEPITISKWMLWVWFGLDGTGIQRSTEFHWLLGPILMVAFAFLGNTLFLTILVSMLSSTFANIVANSNAEIQFRRAVLTLEGVKSDAIFAYPPPFNLLAVMILLPLKFVLSDRWFHKLNVFFVRIINAPILLFISFIERRTLWPTTKRPRDAEQLPLTPRAKLKPRPWDISRQFSIHGDIQAVFDAEPPAEIENEIQRDDDLNHTTFEDAFNQEFGGEILGSSRRSSSNKRVNGKDRRDSVAPFGGLSRKLSQLIKEEDEEDDEHTENCNKHNEEVRSRLHALEQTTLRIEKLLGKLCEDLDDELGMGKLPEGTKSRGEGESEVVTLEDLDTGLLKNLEKERKSEEQG